MKPHKSLPLRYLFKGQFQHALFLAGLIPGAYFLAQPALEGSTWWGIPDRSWFWGLILLVVVHQVLVWFVFRTQLMYSLFSRLFGKHDLTVWAVLFLPLLAARPLLTLGLGLADSGSLGWPCRAVQILAGLLLLLPAAYGMGSVVMYFGLFRAVGGDHFRQRYREVPLVQEGAYQYTNHAMYLLVFLLLWAVAFLTGSRAALASALFQHTYIWVHLYCTEEPDMRVIYGDRIV